MFICNCCMMLRQGCTYTHKHTHILSVTAYKSTYKTLVSLGMWTNQLPFVFRYLFWSLSHSKELSCVHWTFASFHIGMRWLQLSLCLPWLQKKKFKSMCLSKILKFKRKAVNYWTFKEQSSLNEYTKWSKSEALVHFAFHVNI